MSIVNVIRIYIIYIDIFKYSIFRIEKYHLYVSLEGLLPYGFFTLGFPMPGLRKPAVFLAARCRRSPPLSAAMSTPPALRLIEDGSCS